MNRLIPVWTDTHTRALLIVVHVAVGIAVVTQGSGGGGDLWFSLIVASLFVLTVIVGLAFDWLIVLATGFACATLLFFLRPPATYPAHVAFSGGLLSAFFLVSSGMAAQFAGDRTRRMDAPPSQDSAPSPPGAGAPVFGSLGLLRGALGELRLEEEIDRARRYGRPLSVGRVLMDYRQGIAAEEREGATQAVTRIFESTLRLTDVAYAYEAHDIVAILPETDEEGAWLFLSRIVDIILMATTYVRPEHERRPIGAYVTPHFAIVNFPRDGDSVTELLDASEELIRIYREDRSRAFPGADVVVPLSGHRGPQLDPTAGDRYAAALAADSLLRAKENDSGPDGDPSDVEVRVERRQGHDVSRHR